MRHPNTDREYEIWAKQHSEEITKKLSDVYRHHYISNVSFIRDHIMKSNIFVVIILTLFLALGIKFTFTIGIVGGVVFYWICRLLITPIITTTLKLTFRDREYRDILKAYIDNLLEDDFRNARSQKEWDDLEYIRYKYLDVIPFDLPYDK